MRPKNINVKKIHILNMTVMLITIIQSLNITAHKLNNINEHDYNNDEQVKNMLKHTPHTRFNTAAIYP
jgi:hypothetical protein